MSGMGSVAGRVHHSILPTWLGLIAGSWFGLAWGSLISAPVGVGFAVAAGSIFGGFIGVPLWGTIWGFIGLGRQRDSALKQGDIKLVSEGDPLAQRVFALSGNLGLPVKPWVGVMPYNNAYAIGSNPSNALVVIGQPLINNLTEDEVNAIIGHELGHVINNDMRRMGLARSFQNALVWYLGFSKTLQRWARWILTWASELLVLRLSRHREYWADAIGAALTSKEAMISALEKLHRGPDLSDFERQNARLMFRGVALGSLLSTHPTLEERKAALQSESYIRRLPALPRYLSPQTNPNAELPKWDDIGYAKKD